MKARVWERSRFWKKKLRYFCWDLKSESRESGSIRACLEGEGRFRDGGRDPIVGLIEDGLLTLSPLCVGCFVERERGSNG